MDSLLAIELRNSLSGLFHSQFPSTILFDHPTLRTFAVYLEKELFAVDRTSPVNDMKPSPLAEGCKLQAEKSPPDEGISWASST